MTKERFRNLLGGFLTLTLAVFLLVPAAASAKATVKASDFQTRTDAEISKDLQRVIDRNLFREVFDWVEASVSGGQVILTGAVNRPYRRTALSRQVAKIEGVRAVQNHVEVLPVSGFDSQLRRQAVRAIYSHIQFNHYPRLGTPPIHIVVENGRITLEGEVTSRVQFRLAESLVRQRTVGFGVENNLRVSQEEAPF